MAKKPKSDENKVAEPNYKLNVDLEMDYQRVQGLAKIVEDLPEETKEALERFFRGDKSREYYSGMLAGYLHSIWTTELPEKRDFKKLPETKDLNQLSETEDLNQLAAILLLYMGSVAKLMIDKGKFREYLH